MVWVDGLGLSFSECRHKGPPHDVRARLVAGQRLGFASIHSRSHPSTATATALG